jgi:hypothetical protein
MFGFKKRATKKLYETLTEVKSWHKRTFKDCTLAGQLAKLEEELKEYDNAPDWSHSLAEMADVLIVLGGLDRWKSKIGEYMLQGFLSQANTRTIELWNVTVKAKLDINKRRIWKKKADGSYHHIKGK